MNDVVTVSIIGSAGRNGDGEKMNKDLFSLMTKKVEDIITNTFGLRKSNIVLVSGGSAWADHVAVYLWLEACLSGPEKDYYAGLSLYLPGNIEVAGNGVRFLGTTGQTLQVLHSNFSMQMGSNFNSSSDLLCAQALGADFNCNYPGFLNRNIQVAKSEYLIAFSWGESNQRPTLKGGTTHTWDHCRSSHKIHVPLSSIHRPINPIMNAFAVGGGTIGRKRKIEKDLPDLDLPI